MFENIINAFSFVLQMEYLLYITAGTVIGIFVGCLPGLSTTMGLALILPITYSMEPTQALFMLAAMYCGGMFGGSIPAILIGIPGTGGSSATLLDGYEMAKNGEAGKALGMATVSSFIGGVMGVLILFFLSEFLAGFALRFGHAEYFALGVFGLTIVITLSSESLNKGLIAGVIGLLLSTIGGDVVTGVYRFTFNIRGLFTGLDFVMLTISLFAVSQLLKQAEEGTTQIDKSRITTSFKDIIPSVKDLKDCFTIFIRSSIIGSMIGVLPGAGGSIAGFVAYSEAKRTSKTPRKFGTGYIQGVAATETANNAATGGAMVPLLLFGIPGSASTAVILGAFIVHGIQPGPRLFVESADLSYGIMASMGVAAFIFAIVGFALMKPLASLLKLKDSILGAVVIALSVIGTFSTNFRIFDILLVLIIGVFAYIMKNNKFPLPPILLGFLLGPLVENNFRRTIVASRGDYSVFFTRPITLILLLISAFVVIMPIARSYIDKRKKALH